MSQLEDPPVQFVPIEKLTPNASPMKDYDDGFPKVLWVSKSRRGRKDELRIVRGNRTYHRAKASGVRELPCKIWEIHDLFDDLCKIISRWRPTKYENERGYRDNLADFLRGRLKGHRAWKELSSEVRTDYGPGIPDIRVGKSVGIETKKDLGTKAEVKKTVGRLEEGYYWIHIIVIVGAKNHKRLVQELSDRVPEIQRLLNEPESRRSLSNYRYKLVNKGSYRLPGAGSTSS